MSSWLLRHMQARDTEQEHRASTPLELFFDLTFVVAVSFAAAGLAEAVETGRTAHGVAVFAMAFFAIWWGWLNFTWFASAYDTDDWLYRVVTLVQMGGALTVAAGIPPVFSGGHFTVIVVGYVIMRLAMVCQWLRAWRNDRARRAAATIYIAGITLLQVLWVVRLSLPASLGNVSFVVLMLGELAIPALAERRAVTMFHRGHVAERYGLFTIIVLGEGVLASGNSIIEALQDGEHVRSLVTLAVSGLAVLAGMWWLYFVVESSEKLTGYREAFVWGYGHYAIFAAAAAVSSGIEVQVAAITGTGHADGLPTRLALALPLAVFVLVVWALVLRSAVPRGADAVVLAGAAAMFAAGFVPVADATSTAIEAVLVAAVVAGVVGLGGARSEPVAAEPA